MKRNQNYLLSIGHVKNYGLAQKDRRHHALLEDNVNIK
jgi:hypothetical protein